MFSLFKLLSALAAMIALPNAKTTEGARQPIYLVVEPAGSDLRFRVMGASKAEFEASFSLEVTGGGNQSRHLGSAKLAGGEAVVLSTVTLGNVARGQWRALLRVEPQGGEAYEQVRSSP